MGKDRPRLADPRRAETAGSQGGKSFADRLLAGQARDADWLRTEALAAELAWLHVEASAGL